MAASWFVCRVPRPGGSPLPSRGLVNGSRHGTRSSAHRPSGEGLISTAGDTEPPGTAAESSSGGWRIPTAPDGCRRSRRLESQVRTYRNGASTRRSSHERLPPARPRHRAAKAPGPARRGNRGGDPPTDAQVPGLPRHPDAAVRARPPGTRKHPRPTLRGEVPGLCRRLAQQGDARRLPADPAVLRALSPQARDRLERVASHPAVLRRAGGGGAFGGFTRQGPGVLAGHGLPSGGREGGLHGLLRRGHCELPSRDARPTRAAGPRPDCGFRLREGVLRAVLRPPPRSGDQALRVPLARGICQTHGR